MHSPNTLLIIFSTSLTESAVQAGAFQLLPRLVGTAGLRARQDDSMPQNKPGCDKKKCVPAISSSIPNSTCLATSSSANSASGITCLGVDYVKLSDYQECAKCVYVPDCNDDATARENACGQGSDPTSIDEALLGPNMCLNSAKSGLQIPKMETGPNTGADYYLKCSNKPIVRSTADSWCTYNCFSCPQLGAILDKHKDSMDQVNATGCANPFQLGT